MCRVTSTMPNEAVDATIHAIEAGWLRSKRKKKKYINFCDHQNSAIDIDSPVITTEFLGSGELHIQYQQKLPSMCTTLTPAIGLFQKKKTGKVGERRGDVRVEFPGVN